MAGLAEGTYLIKNNHTGRALDGGGANAHVYGNSDPDRNNRFHQWHVVSARAEGGADLYYIQCKGAAGDSYLDGGGDHVYLNSEHTLGNHWQTWKLGDEGTTLIVVKSNGKALTSHDSEAITLEPSNPGSQYQHWILERV